MDPERLEEKLLSLANEVETIKDCVRAGHTESARNVCEDVAHWLRELAERVIVESQGSG